MPKGRRTTHRASYILERGSWHATCQGCGWQTSSPKRQVAASVFRLHIQSMRAQGAPPGETEETPVV